VKLVNECHRDGRPLPWLEDAQRDVRHAIRMFGRTPGFTAAAIITLALGIGATTAIVSVLSALLFRPLPYPHSDRLVRIIDSSDSPARVARSLATVDADELEVLRSTAKTLSAIGVFPGTALWLTTPHAMTQLFGTRVSPMILPMLGARPLVGRLFEPREEAAGAAPVVILAYATWQRFFGGDPEILQQQVTLDGRAFSVVGVMPRGFEFPSAQSQFWAHWA
jgi:hypothetical protein